MSATTSLESSAIVAAAGQALPAKVFQAHEWLTFRLGAEEYGMDILCVQEIRSYERPTRIANAPDYVKGVVNLRGVIVPILDLRMKLGVSDLRYDGSTVTVVLNVGRQVVGCVVDSVCEVLRLGEDDIKPVPHMTTSLDSRFITGIGSVEGDGVERMLILLDVAALVASLSVGSASHAAA